MTSVQRPPDGTRDAEGRRTSTHGLPSDLAELVRAHQAAVWRYLRLCGADVHEADDLLQETFVVFATGQRSTGLVSPRGYLCGIAKNLLLAARRRERRQPPAADWLDEVDRLAASPGDALGDARVVALRECLQRLTGRAQQALVWRHLDELPRAEVASRLGLGDEGTKSLLERARETLRDCVQRRLQKEERT